MVKIKEAILVEGRYDVNTLRQIVDTLVLKTDGFGIFNRREQLRMIKHIAEKRGLIILTDSDGAGLVIRNYLKNTIPKEWLRHAYIPELYGKEHRKKTASKEGKLGVEGMPPDIILKALQDAGATFLDAPCNESCEPHEAISKADLYELGLLGQKNSIAKRKALLTQLALPSNLSSNALLQYLNIVSNRTELAELLKKTEPD